MGGGIRGSHSVRVRGRASSSQDGCEMLRARIVLWCGVVAYVHLRIEHASTVILHHLLHREVHCYGDHQLSPKYPI